MSTRRGVLIGLGSVLAPAPAVTAPEDGWLAFELTDGGVVLPATLNGAPARGILDSGASHTLVDVALAARAGLRQSGAGLSVNGWSNTAQAQRTEPATLAIGAFHHTLPLLVMAFGDGPPEPVLLGRDLFDRQIIELDFDARRLRILPSDRASAAGFLHVSRPAATARDASAAAERGAAKNLIPMFVEGHSVDARLDLGTETPLHVSRPFADRWRLLQGRRTSSVLSSDIGGLRTSPVFTCAEVVLGGVAFRNVPAEVFEAPVERVVIGRELISRFRVRLDMAREDLWLRPGGSDPRRPFPRDRAGLLLQSKGGRAEVVFVAPGSPAQADGWQVGEGVATIDGVAPEVRGRAWRFGPAGERHLLVTDRGVSRSLVLADYY